ncbi:MAG: metallophosphoesterase family protein [Streptosporangiaceae bacterium]
MSDTHLSPDAPEAQENWGAVVRYVTAAAPDLVIHLGDLSLDGARNPADIDHARGQLEMLPVPWTAVPGNHDIGDNPRPGAPEGLSVTEARRQRWLDVVGADYWSLDIADWTLLALNAQLAGSGLAAETSQWSWLDDQLRRADADQRIALLAHKPLTAPEAELATAPPYRFWPPASRDRLGQLFAVRRPALLISGHVHQSRLLRLDRTWHVWVPTTWAVLPARMQPVLGAKRSGLLSLAFESGIAPEPRFCEPDGIRQLTLTADIKDPYHGR